MQVLIQHRVSSFGLCVFRGFSAWELLQSLALLWLLWVGQALEADALTSV